MITDEDLMRAVELTNKVIKELCEKKAAMLSETDKKTIQRHQCRRDQGFLWIAVHAWCSLPEFG